MFEWFNGMNSAELSTQASTYAMRASEPAGVSTRESLDRLASACAALAVAREVEEAKRSSR